MAARYKLGRVCGCGTRVSDKSKTGNCLRCNLRKMNTDPVVIAGRVARFRKMLAENPAERHRRAMQMKINKRNGMKNPDAQARVRAAALRNLPKAFTPEARAKQRVNSARGLQRWWDEKLSWCPPERREEYHNLIRQKRLLAAEAKRIILDSMTPFERQMNALRRGAKLVANDAGPGPLEPRITDPTMRRAG